MLCNFPNQADSDFPFTSPTSFLMLSRILTRKAFLSLNLPLFLLQHLLCKFVSSSYLKFPNVVLLVRATAPVCKMLCQSQKMAKLSSTLVANSPPNFGNVKFGNPIKEVYAPSNLETLFSTKVKAIFFLGIFLCEILCLVKVFAFLVSG